jgi:hypothetical protein
VDQLGSSAALSWESRLNGSLYENVGLDIIGKCRII